MEYESIIQTRNGEHSKKHDSYRDAWSYIQAFMAVTKDAEYWIVGRRDGNTSVPRV